MGRLVLLIGAIGALSAAALLGGCAPDATSQSRADEDPHAELACAACHQDGTADRTRPAVSGETCTGSGCHEDAGPARIRLATVTFDHRNHGDDQAVAMSCAGCHTHEAGGEALSGGTRACALCHVDGMDGDEPGDCRACHELPTHVGATSQGVTVPHQGMPWIEGECVRCHYDVSPPEIAVEPASCAGCHRDLDEVVARSIGEDLHPAHTTVSCAACHTEGEHRIVAMSSAVELECAQCHVRSHDLDVAETFAGTAGSHTCAACHRDTHEAQQRLVLGVLPGAHEAHPSEKFLDGLTCRSCHVGADRTAAESTADVVTGQDISCVGCHRQEYATVLSWWNTGTEQRLQAVRSYLLAAEGALAAQAAGGTRSGAADGDPDPASVAGLLVHARADVELLEAGGGAHNLPLSHDLLAEAVSLVGDAYAAAGRTPPPRPELGTRPSQGLCSYCHYRTDDRMRLREMDPRFHRDVLGVTDSRR